MKTILAVLFFTLFVIWGCENSNDLSVNNFEPDYNSSLSRMGNYEIIPLPNKSQLWMDSVFTMSKEIDGSVGGRMIMEKYYISDEDDSVVMKSDLRIPAGAFQGTKTITMTVDNENSCIHFSPSMIFDDTLRLFQSFEGLHLENYQTGTIDFVFIDDNGSIELIKNNGIQVVVPQGIVRIQNAKLVHFSRYGWVRKTFLPIEYSDIEVD